MGRGGEEAKYNFFCLKGPITASGRKRKVEGGAKSRPPLGGGLELDHGERGYFPFRGESKQQHIGKKKSATAA